MLSQAYDITTDCGVIFTGHGREAVDGLNETDKRFLFQLMETVQLHVSKVYDTHMDMKSVTHISNNSLAREFQKHLSNVSRKNG